MRQIERLFNTEDEKELKNSLREIVKNQFESELRELEVYLFDPETVQDMIQEMYEEIIKEIKDEVKNTLKNKILENLNVSEINLGSLLK